MKSVARLPGTPSTLSDSLRHNLNMYALTASAAGVSLLALAQPSEARIVYTKTHQVIGRNGVYPIDLNHDGVIDFLIQQERSLGSNVLLAKGAFGNPVEGAKYFAEALKKGAAIGPRQRFISSSGTKGEYMAQHVSTESGRSYWTGQWADVSNRYLGLRFQIDGKTHYGWARLSTQTQGYQITATLTGYAYETVPRKGIRAGQIVGDREEVTPNSDSTELEESEPIAAVVAPRSRTTQPSLLGRLALGAQGIALRRRQ
jgi:hypothetical protein